MWYLVKRLIRKSFLFLSLSRIKKFTKILFHDAQAFPIKNIRNYIRANRFLKIHNSALPQIAHIEVTNICNAQCVMCPQSSMKRELGNMQDFLYRKIIQQCRPLQAVWMFMMGEPLMDKSLPERVAYAKDYGIKKVGIFTNASVLNPDLADKLLASGIDHITISFDALTEQTYKEIRPGLNFQDVTVNIVNLVNLRKRQKRKAPFIAIEFVKIEKNTIEAEPFRKRWERIVDAVYIADMVNWGGVNQAKAAAGLTYKIRSPCYMLWKDMVIFMDGRVALCCYDYEGSVILGDASKQSLKEIWTGEKLAELRKIHMNREFGKIPICTNCNVWKIPSLPWWW